MKSVYSPELKCLLYKRFDKNKMNGIGRLQAAFRLYPIMHWTEPYTRFPPFCQVIQSCSQAWKGQNDDDLVRPVRDSRFCSLSCVFLTLYYFKSPIEGDKRRSHLLCYSRAPVKIGFISCMCTCSGKLGTYRRSCS